MNEQPAPTPEPAPGPGTLDHDSINVTVEAGLVYLHVGGHAWRIDHGQRFDYRDDVDALLRLSAAAMRAIELIRDPALRETDPGQPTQVRWLDT